MIVIGIFQESVHRSEKQDHAQREEACPFRILELGRTVVGSRYILYWKGNASFFWLTSYQCGPLSYLGFCSNHGEKNPQMRILRVNKQRRENKHNNLDLDWGQQRGMSVNNGERLVWHSGAEKST
jgi:hypothetical protein